MPDQKTKTRTVARERRRVRLLPSIARVVPSHRSGETDRLAARLRGQVLLLRSAGDWDALGLSPGASEAEIRAAVADQRARWGEAALKDDRLRDDALADTMEILERLLDAGGRLLEGRPRPGVDGLPGAQLRAGQAALREGAFGVARSLLVRAHHARPGHAATLAWYGWCLSADPKACEADRARGSSLLRQARVEVPEVVERLVGS